MCKRLSLVLSALVVMVSCSPGGMTPNPPSNDAGTSDAGGGGDAGSAMPGAINFSYECDDIGPGMVTLTKEKFGTAFQCSFSEQYIDLRYDSIPDKPNEGPKFKIQMKANYKGPGRYMIPARIVYGGAMPVCVWDAMSVIVSECFALQSIGGGCCDANRPDDALTCDVTVTEHTKIKVAGMFSCTVHAGGDRGRGCMLISTATVAGSFAYGPEDCK